MNDCIITSCPDATQQNGINERKIITYLKWLAVFLNHECTHTILVSFYHECTYTLLVDAIFTAYYLINLWSSPLLGNKLPIEIFFLVLSCDKFHSTCFLDVFFLCVYDHSALSNPHFLIKIWWVNLFTLLALNLISPPQLVLSTSLCLYHVLNI